MHICISGLTAAGKTTHAELLARDLDMRFVSATEILAKLCGVEFRPSMWLDEVAQVGSIRDSSPIDVQLDDELAQLFRSTTPTVFDSWALPWLADRLTNDCLYIWFESDFSSRVRKSRVSALPRDLSYQAARSLVSGKDQDAVQRFGRLYGFDLRHDRRPFDLVVDNGGLIPLPTDEWRRRGIAHLRSALTPKVSALVSVRSRPDRPELMRVSYD
jgi:cytidylate kinase